MVIVANEISGTLSFYQISCLPVSTDDIVKTPNTMVAFPNPANNQIFLEREDDYRVIDLQGKMVQTVQSQDVLDVSNLPSGMYFVIRKDGAIAKVAVQH